MRPDSVYLDYAASTPVDPTVVEAMMPYFSESYGNPASTHQWGQHTSAAVEESRARVASIFGCASEEIIFTSCGSESDNLALRGVAFAERQRRDATHILTSPVEHPAVLRTAEDLASKHHFDLEFLPVDQFGRVSPVDLAERIRSDTALVSLIFANNEIGTINPVADLGAICHEQGIPFHTDAVQAPGQLSMRVDDLNVDLASIGAHKFYGPKGIGALYVRSGLRLQPTLTGGSQEFGLRAGTHNVPLIVGLAEAIRLADEGREAQALHFQRLRQQIIEGVLQKIENAQLTGHPAHRLPNHASFVLPGVDGNELVAALDLAGFACSSGSACKTGSPEPSKVLLALGIPPSPALGGLRVTVGRSTSPEDVQRFLKVLPMLVPRLRQTYRPQTP